MCQQEQLMKNGAVGFLGKCVHAAVQDEGGRCVADAAGRLCMHRRVVRYLNVLPFIRFRRRIIDDKVARRETRRKAPSQT